MASQPLAPVRARLTVADAMEPYEHQIADDTTIDQANDIFDDNPGIPYLLVRDAIGRCEGLVTRSALLVFLARSWYTEHTLIRDITHQRGPFARPAMKLEFAAEAMRSKNLRVWPVVDYDGLILGVLTTRRVNAMPPALQPS